MQVRPVTDTPRTSHHSVRRLIAGVLRWAFVTGAAVGAAVTFAHFDRIRESLGDPAFFAIGTAGLFGLLCGATLLLMSRDNRLVRELHQAKKRCEELADSAWEAKEGEARAASLLEAQGDLIVRRDNQGRITYVNDAYCALTGTLRDALLGTATAPQSLQLGRLSVLPDGTRLHDEQIMTAAGARWVAWCDVVVWAESGERAEVQSVGRDVTDRIDAERVMADARDAAEAASGAKSRFLAMVSHEIRTPLNGILGMAGLLSDTPLTPEQTTYVKATKTSGTALLSLIEDILDFSKIEAGKLELETRPFSPAQLVEDVVELLAPRAQAKNLEIASDVDERLPERVIGDATRVRQVLLNLAGNAIKFTETGGVGVIVEAGAAPDEIVFEVRDTGIGIAPEQQTRIFREFEQAEGGAARKFGGAGLGLAISRRIVERMGGRIEVASKPSQGASFRAIIPLPPAEGNETADFVAPDLAGRAVLIVALPTIEASLIERRLTRWGAGVMHIAPHLAGMLAQRHWDAVLVDHAIGAEALAGISRPTGRDAPRRIVLVTPGERQRLPALKDAGFGGYLVKPVRAASLKAQLAPVPGFDVAAPTATMSTRTAATASKRKMLSVLVAEDNEINALLTLALLTRLGHRPTIAGSGGAALTRWTEARDNGTPFDLVLMDMHMPGIDGLEAARRIRASEAVRNTPRTSMIALTANAFAEDREACLAAGMDGFLVKPLDRDRLALTLDEVAGKTSVAA